MDIEHAEGRETPLEFRKIDSQGRNEGTVDTVVGEALARIGLATDAPYAVIGKYPRRKRRSELDRYASLGMRFVLLGGKRHYLLWRDYVYCFVMQTAMPFAALVTNDYPDERYYRIVEFRSAPSQDVLRRLARHFLEGEDPSALLRDESFGRIALLCFPEGKGTLFEAFAH